MVLVIEPATTTHSGNSSADREVLLSQILVRVKRTLHHGTAAASTRSGRCALVIALDGRSDEAELALRVHGALIDLKSGDDRLAIHLALKPCISADSRTEVLLFDELGTLLGVVGAVASRPREQCVAARGARRRMLVSSESSRLG